MKISHIKEAPLLRAYLLINQEKNKKNAFKSIQTEISKMSELFGLDFDRNLHLILFNDIDFKDPKSLQKSKDRKIDYFLQDFPQFIDRADFIETSALSGENLENAFNKIKLEAAKNKFNETKSKKYKKGLKIHKKNYSIFY